MTFLLAMVLHPEAAARAQKEIDEVTGGRRMPCLDDRESLPYVDCIVKEVMRLVTLVLKAFELGLTRIEGSTLQHLWVCCNGTTDDSRCNILAFIQTGLPHRSIKSDTYDKTHIPEGSTVIANIW